MRDTETLRDYLGELAAMSIGNYVEHYLKERTKIIDGLEYRLSEKTGRYERWNRDRFGVLIHVWLDSSDEDAPILEPDVGRYAKEKTKTVDGLEYRLNPKTGIYEHWGRNRHGGLYCVQLNELDEDAPIIEGLAHNHAELFDVDAPVLDDAVENRFGYRNESGRYCIETDPQRLLKKELPVDNYFSKNRVFLRSLAPDLIRILPVKKEVDISFYTDDRAIEAVLLSEREAKPYIDSIRNALDFCGRVVDNMLNCEDVSPYFAQVKILDAIVNRGNYNENTRLVSLSGFTPEEVGEVTAHEMGHVVESLLPGVRLRARGVYIGLTTKPDKRTRTERILITTDGFEQCDTRKEYYRIGNIAVPDVYALKDMNDKRTELVSVFFKELYGNPLDLVNSYRDFYVKIVTEVFGNGNGKGQNLHYSKRRRLRRMVQNALCRHGRVFRRRTR